MSTKVEKMISLIKDIPDLKINPLTYVLENFKTEEGLWLEFGVYKGSTINKISTYRKGKVYGFDTFEGLPEDWRPKYTKGYFSLEGNMPEVNENVTLIKGLFQDTLVDFLKEKNEKITFIHIDSDIYSAAKFILDTCKPYFAEKCYVVFDELVNFEYFESEHSELMALYDFMEENKELNHKWIGMKGELNLSMTKGVKGYYYPYHQNAAICFF